MGTAKKTGFKESLIKDLKTIKFKNFIFLTIAGIINSCGVTLFLAPVNIYDSGLSGTSLLLNAISNNFLSLSFFLIILNLPFFIIGFRKQGAAFTVYSIYAVAMYSAISLLIQHVLPISFEEISKTGEIIAASPIGGSDLLLCALFGGLLSGVGSGMTIRFGGAIDGIEVMAVIFAKYIGITVGTFVMIYNAILYTFAGVIFASWEIPLYSIITYMVGLKAVDFVVDGLDKAKAAMIITSNPKAIADELSQHLGRGITMIDGKGYYSKENKTILYCVVNRFQIGKLKRILVANDPSAFVTITDISDTLGTSLKFSLKKKKQNSNSNTHNDKMLISDFPLPDDFDSFNEAAATFNNDDSIANNDSNGDNSQIDSNDRQFKNDVFIENDNELKELSSNKDNTSNNQDKS